MGGPHMVLQRRSLFVHWNSFATFLNDNEAFLNNRPIPDDSTDINDTDALTALTPNHFLLGRAHIKVPAGHFDNKRVTYCRRWKYAQQIADHVWKRLIKEYLPTLQLRQKWLKRTARLKFGQTVWILKDFTPRLPFWKNLSYRRQRHTAASSVRSQDKNRNFHNSSIRLAPIETEERLHHDDDDNFDDDEEEEEAKIITQ